MALLELSVLNSPMDTRLILCCDFGTSALTASHVQCTSYIDHEGDTKWHSHTIYKVDNWPEADFFGTAGNYYLPTDLVFSRATKQLLFWGLEPSYISRQFLRRFHTRRSSSSKISSYYFLIETVSRIHRSLRTGTKRNGRY